MDDSGDCQDSCQDCISSDSRIREVRVTPSVLRSKFQKTSTTCYAIISSGLIRSTSLVEGYWRTFTTGLPSDLLLCEHLHLSMHMQLSYISRPKQVNKLSICLIVFPASIRKVKVHASRPHHSGGNICLVGKLGQHARRRPTGWVVGIPDQIPGSFSSYNFDIAIASIAV